MKTHNVVSEVHSDVGNIHTMVSDIHRTIVKRQEGGGGGNVSVSDSHTYQSLDVRLPLRRLRPGLQFNLEYQSAHYLICI